MSAADRIHAAVLAALQDADELGGPEGAAYVDLMVRIAQECAKRCGVAISHVARDRIADPDVLDLMEQQGGGFVSALAKAWSRADSENSFRLMAAFGATYDRYAAQARSAR